MLLVLILLIPLLTGIVCLLVRKHWLMETLNLLAFGGSLVLSIVLLHQVLEKGVVTTWDSFFRADALSAWMILLVTVVSLSSAFYARSYFRHELAAGDITSARVREFYVLTPFFSAAMCLVLLADNLGVMWVALEVTAMASVLLVALYNRPNSLEASTRFRVCTGTW